MKLLLLILTLLGQVFVLAQSSSMKMNAWDSLRSRTTEEINRFEEIARDKAAYIDTLRKEGSITVTYVDNNRHKLKLISNFFNSENCLAQIQSEYFNSQGLLAFRKGYKKCCPEETTEDYKCFEKTTYYERFEYDNKSRLTKHVYHVTTPGTYKETFPYGLEGTQQMQRVTIEETKFWE